MTTIGDILDAIDRAAPFDTAMSFDNVGLLAGKREQTVRRVLLALDITRDVVQEAAALDAQLILSHHPVIFHPLKAIDPDSPVGCLMKHGIAAIGCHTNLDTAKEIGVNISLCRAIGLKNIAQESEEILIGEVEETDIYDFGRMVKEKLGCSHVELTPTDTKIRKVAVCSGAGGEFVFDLKGKCDVFLTGEARHDEYVYALDQSVPMVTAGHYYTERVFAKTLEEYLKRCLPELEFKISETESCPTVVL